MPLLQQYRRLAHAGKVTIGQRVNDVLALGARHGVGPARRIVNARGLPATKSFSGFQSIAPAESFELRPPDFADPGGSDFPYAEFFARGCRRGTDEVGTFSADDVRVVFPTSLALCRGRVLRESLLSDVVLTNPKYAWQLQSIPFRAKRRHDEAILLSMHWHHNFYHWILEILPRLALLDASEALRDLPIVVPLTAPAFVRESLELTPYADRVEYVEDGVYRFRRLHFLSRLALTVTVSPLAIRWLKQVVGPRLSPGDRPKRLYVSRRDALIRFMSNEDELQEVLDRFGFESVVMGRLGLAEQFAHFASAEVVLGAHGANMTSMAFGQRGATLIEIFQDGHFNDCFFQTARHLGARYGYLVGRRRGSGIDVEPQRLSDALDALLTEQELKGRDKGTKGQRDKVKAV